jgi:hypothetical protein
LSSLAGFATIRGITHESIQGIFIWHWRYARGLCVIRQDPRLNSTAKELEPSSQMSIPRLGGTAILGILRIDAKTTRHL